jgi:hypothetical protein
MPAMTPDELRTLGEDVRQYGLRSPIVLFIPGCYDDDDDEPPAAVLLDGKNRLDALEAAGFTPRFTQDVDPRLADRDIVTSLDLDAATFWPVEHLYEWDGGERLDPCEYVRSANIHRKHYKPEEMRPAHDVIKARIAAQPAKSDRAIAAEIGVDHKTVAKVRKKAESTAEVSPVAKRTGKDGKARKQPKPHRVRPKTKALRDAEAATLTKAVLGRDHPAVKKLTESAAAGGTNEPQGGSDKPTAESPTITANAPARTVIDGLVCTVAGDPPAAIPLTVFEARVKAKVREVFVKRPEALSYELLYQCREVARVWDELAAEFADKLQQILVQARQAQGNDVDADASAQERKAAMAAEN